MKARFLGCLVGGVREERVGFTIGNIYKIIDTSPQLGVSVRFVLRDDDGALRHRPQSDFEVVR